MEYVIAPDDRYLPPPLDVHVGAGEQVEVDDETAASLRAQGWPKPGSAEAREVAARLERERSEADTAAGDEGPPQAPDTDTAGAPADIEE